MPSTFLGLRNVGKKQTGEKQSKATLSWQVGIVTADGVAATQNVPGIGAISGWEFTLDPGSVQSSFTFGDVKTIQAAVQRALSQIQDATHGYFAGRTFLYVVSTGQLFEFYKQPISTGFADTGGYTVQNSIVPCDALQPGIIKVFIEADTLNGALVAPGNMAQTNVAITLFNYDVAPVSL
jgi:hypothetical protein